MPSSTEHAACVVVTTLKFLADMDVLFAGSGYQDYLACCSKPSISWLQYLSPNTLAVSADQVTHGYSSHGREGSGVLCLIRILPLSTSVCIIFVLDFILNIFQGDGF